MFTKKISRCAAVLYAAPKTANSQKLSHIAVGLLLIRSNRDFFFGPPRGSLALLVLEFLSFLEDLFPCLPNADFERSGAPAPWCRIHAPR